MSAVTLDSNTTTPLRTSTTPIACESRCGSTPTTKSSSSASIRNDLQPRLGDNSGAGLGVKTAGGRTVTGHARKRADRLLIRPTSGRQAGTGLFARTDPYKDTRKRSHFTNESRTKSTGTNLTTAPDGTPNTLTVHKLVAPLRFPGFAAG